MAIATRRSSLGVTTSGGFDVGLSEVGDDGKMGLARRQHTYDVGVARRLIEDWHRGKCLHPLDDNPESVARCVLDANHQGPCAGAVVA